MATILNDKEIQRLIGSVILDGDENCVRPNAYILRVGKKGEFLNTDKEFELGGGKKGIRIPAGHSVGITAFETLDFRRETVHKLFPDNDLHGFLSPTTDLSREGLIAPTTQVDAGYHGTLNWTITNPSHKEAAFLLEESVYRLTIFKLEKGETPESVYAGHYQGQMGYVRSQRRGAPRGMKDSEWVTASTGKGPEKMLEDLIKSGYPWSALGSRLRAVDDQFKAITDEYSNIRDAFARIENDIKKEMPETVRRVLKEEANAMQNRWLVGAGALIFAFGGAALSLFFDETALAFIKEHSAAIGLGALVVGVLLLVFLFRQR